LDSIAVEYAPLSFQKLNGVKGLIFYGNGVAEYVFVKHGFGKVRSVLDLYANFNSIGYDVIHNNKGDKEKPLEWYNPFIPVFRLEKMINKPKFPLFFKNDFQITQASKVNKFLNYPFPSRMI
jgi:hypothetical protein